MTESLGALTRSDEDRNYFRAFSRVHPRYYFYFVSLLEMGGTAAASYASSA